MHEINDHLFDPSLLVDWDESLQSELDGSGFRLRPLRLSDYENGYLDVLAQLTSVGEMDKTTFQNRFNEMKKASGCYYILVLEDESTRKIAGSATLLIEFKFIHEAALRARLEDVVVDEAYRGRHLGKILVEAVKQLARKRGCYKISLDCSDKFVNFYKSFGYAAEPGRDNTLVIRFSD
ncbi:putative glucosamine 6-phosphate N-acetyltransferase [Halotydeus destructor]|nr:putative glucosamine 6-phosphate N-acetyltransferase [Halotydeus destructor]